MSTPNPPAPPGTLEERLAYYSSEALPNSIRNISENSKNLTPVIEYLEQAYLTAPDQQAQADVETQAKTYLVDALTTVVDDINTIANNLEQFVGLQMDAVDSLGTQMALLKTKMTLYKEQHGTEKFNSYRDPVVTASGTYSRKLDENAAGGFSTSANLSSVLQPSSELLADAISTLHAPAEEKTSNGRVPLHERMSRLDDVGICLDKEEGKQSAKASVMSSSTVLRRASHTKNASQNSSDMSQSLPSESLGPPPDDDDSSVVSMSSQNSGRPMVPPPRLSAVHH